MMMTKCKLMAASVIALVYFLPALAHAHTDCVKYDESQFADIDHASISTALSNSHGAIDGDVERRFDRVWASYAVREKTDPLMHDPLTHLLLANRAHEMGFSVLALASLDSANIRLNRSNLCEVDLLRFFVDATRHQVLIELFDVSEIENRLLEGFNMKRIYENLMKGNRYPFHPPDVIDSVWMSDFNFLEIQCLIPKLDASSISGFSREMIQSCE